MDEMSEEKIVIPIERRLKPCPFCGSEAVHTESSYFRDTLIYCENCDAYFTVDSYAADEHDVIEAWNRRAERTAKVIEHEYRIGTSLNIVGEPKICHEYLCGACKKKVIGGDEYCSHCGCRLDWDEDIPMEYFESGGI